MSERSYEWKRNRQLIFLGALLVILAVAVCLLLSGYFTGWLFVVVAALGVLQPVFVLWSLRQHRPTTTVQPKRNT